MRELKKTLSITQGVGILTSTLLGSGIFIVPAIVATIAGTNSLFAWIAMILFSLPIAYTFGELGALYPNASGTAFFVEKSFGKKLGEIISWLYLSVIPIGPPVVIITAANYLGAIFKATQNEIFIICLFMLVLMFIINFFGLSLSSNIQTIISIIIVAVLTLIIFAGFYNIFHGNLASQNVFVLDKIKLAPLGKAISMAFWCFVGIEAVAHLASEFKNVEKDFPKAISISVITVGILYLLISFMVLKFNAYGTEELNNNSLVYLIDVLIGRYGKIFIGIMGFLTCFAAVNLYLLSCSRLLYAMNKDNLLSNTTKRGVPINALLFTFTLAGITILLKFSLHIDLANLISYANGVFVLIYLSAMVSGIKLLRRYKRGLAILSTIFTFCILLWVGKTVLYAGIIVILCALKGALIKKDTSLKYGAAE